MKQLFTHTHTHISKLLFALVIMISFSCQQEEDFSPEEMSDQNSLIEISSTSDHLVFNDYQDFRGKFEDLRNQTEDQVSDLLVEEGHRSFRPLITENTVNKYLALYEDQSLLAARVEEDRFEFIGDDLFAALLNEDGEIIVNDSIYKYTPLGIFRAKTEMQERLTFVVDSLMEIYYHAHEGRLTQQCIAEEISPAPGEITPIDDGIDYYGQCGGSGGGSSGPGSSGPSQSTYDRFTDYLSGLTPCSTFNGWWPIGDSKKCDEYFSSNSRVRTKIWNQYFVILSSVGAEVKHQFKSVVWYSAKIDNLYMGLRSAIYTRKLSSFEQQFQYIPTTANEQRNFYYNDKEYFVSNGTNPSISTTPIRSIDDGLPDGYDMNYVIHLPSTGYSSWATKSYIEETIWPDVVDQINDFILDNGLDPGAVQGMILTINAGTKEIYKVWNVYRERSNEKKIKEDLAEMYEFKLKFKNRKFNGLDLKFKSPYEDLSAEFYGVGRRGNSFAGDLLVVDDLDATL